MNAITTTRNMVEFSVPAKYWGILMVALVGLFLIGLDQGQTLSTIMGQTAYQQNFLHELFHDVRHAAGFVCH
tara:strand:- start:166 stop:381 length:216 start_codon:yes stop_codon:yes gene_type:complete